MMLQRAPKHEPGLTCAACAFISSKKHLKQIYGYVIGLDSAVIKIQESPAQTYTAHY